MNMRARYVVLVLTVMVGGLWGGYHAMPRDEDALMSAEAVPQLEYLIGPESFSSIDNARSALAGLCERSRVELRIQLVKASRLPAMSPERQHALDAVIQKLKSEMHDLDGTAQGVGLAQDLLIAMKSAGQFDGWIEVYLELLYAHPTHPALLRLAERALSIGRVAGREGDVAQALAHVSAIPLDFAGKGEILGALAKAKAEHTFTSWDNPRVRPIAGSQE
jgi:hypothetical protein